MSDYCIISKEIEFDAGHRVPSHRGKCSSPHGHRYKIKVKCRGKILDEAGESDDGMVIDFSDLKEIMTEKIHEVLDHSFIVWKDDDRLLKHFEQQSDWRIVVLPHTPTAENLARWCWQQVDYALKHRPKTLLELIEVAIWETPTSVAYYTGKKI